MNTISTTTGNSIALSLPGIGRPWQRRSMSRPPTNGNVAKTVRLLMALFHGRRATATSITADGRRRSPRRAPGRAGPSQSTKARNEPLIRKPRQSIVTRSLPTVRNSRSSTSSIGCQSAAREAEDGHNRRADEHGQLDCEDDPRAAWSQVRPSAAITGALGVNCGNRALCDSVQAVRSGAIPACSNKIERSWGRRLEPLSRRPFGRLLALLHDQRIGRQRRGCRPCVARLRARPARRPRRPPCSSLRSSSRRFVAPGLTARHRPARPAAHARGHLPRRGARVRAPRMGGRRPLSRSRSCSPSPLVDGTLAVTARALTRGAIAHAPPAGRICSRRATGCSTSASRSRPSAARRSQAS